MPPVVDPALIEHESYIPMEFAQAKVQEVSTDLNLLKTGYDHYICKMKMFYDSQDKETKSHYENYILELKKKALRHLEMERSKAKRREEHLTATLLSKDEEMEDLRDMNAERISDFQTKILQLKKQHHSDIEDRHECDVALKRILLVIENDAIEKISTNLTEKFSKEIHKKNDEVSGMKKDHSMTLQQLEEEKISREQQVSKEKKEVERVERSRAQLQLAQTTVSDESKLFMSDLLHQLQFKKQQLLLNKESKKVASLKQSKGNHEITLTQLKEELATERKKSAAVIQEYKEKYDSLVDDRDALMAAQAAEQAAKGRRDATAQRRADQQSVKDAMQSLLVGVEQRSQLDDELERERRRIVELNGIIAGLRIEISEAEARGLSQGQVMLQQQQQQQQQEIEELQKSSQPPSQSAAGPAQTQPLEQALTQPPGTAAIITAAIEAQKTEDMAELDRLRDHLAVLQYDVEADEETLADQMKEKSDTKTAIKQWMKTFEAENGRPPNNEEKSSVREMFVAHKAASKQVDALTASLGGKKEEVISTEEQIEALVQKLAAAAAASAAAPAQTGGGVSDEVVEQLKQRINELETTNSELTKHLQNVELEKGSAISLVETLKSEKRTDVIARYEKEIEDLKQNAQALETSVASSKTEKLKQDAKLAELADRAGKAEEELKERDERDAQKVDQVEAVAQLQGQVAKQRNEIVTKSKAATAGWDAAADTEEKYDLDVKKAFKKGESAGREKSKADLDALTAEIEQKEYRITELLEAVSEADQKAAQAVLDMQEAISNANVAIEEALANGGGKRGGGGGGGDTYSSDDNSDDEGGGGEGGAAAEELRADLEAAQEEIGSLCTQVENLQKSLDISNQKSDILEKLLAKSQSDVATASSAKGGPAVSIEELVKKVKQATEHGTKLWKDNKKDECCEHYENISHEIVSTNCQQNLLDTLTTALDSAKGQSNRRGAVILRKGLDNFLAEADKIHSSLASMLSPDAGGPDKDSHDALMNQLKALQEKSVEQKAVEKKGTSATSSDGGAGGGGNAVLIKRAKAAEEKVKSLQKELTAAKKAAPKGKAAAGGSGKGSAEDAKEIKSLNKQIKDLEKQLNSGGGGGGGGGAKEKIALANQEKKFKKEMKEVETSNRKEKASLEKELVGVKSELDKVTEACSEATDERNKLRSRVEELGNANAEMEALRAKADQLDEMQEHVKVMKKEVVELTAQYKKEANLRKKYKNELEDLKGAIRVYARVRPFAKYEIEKDCQSCVKFPDETSVTVHTGRGDKEFEFDAAFRDDSTQEEVFEDTKRLVESMIDGFNVCLFAYGQVRCVVMVMVMVMG
jgi:DNA repair exonuclease SbcCD ATPase subunit